jgi:RNA polymerase sigma factor (sigma-70 family)
VIEARAGRPDQLERLIEAFQPSIGRIARLYRGAPGINRAELMQEGVVGLLRALDRYDPDTGTPFWAYASWWVRQSMQQLVAELSRPIVLSDRALRKLARVRQAERDCGQRSGHQPSLEAIADETGIERTQIDTLRAAERPPVGLDAPVRDDDGATLADFLPDPHAQDPHDVAVQHVGAEELPLLLAGLNERERLIVRSRFGLDGREYTLSELAGQLGVSTERVRQIEQAALGKLRDRSTQC